MTYDANYNNIWKDIHAVQLIRYCSPSETLNYYFLQFATLDNISITIYAKFSYYKACLNEL